MVIFMTESNLDLCYLHTRPIYSKRCMLQPMFMYNTYTKSYMIFQFTLYPLNLDDIRRSNQGHITFKWLYLINGDQSIFGLIYQRNGTCMTNVSMKSYINVQPTS